MLSTLSLDDPSAADARSLAKVLQLPQELQIRIFSFACRSSKAGINDDSLARRSLIALDLETTKALLCASRALNAIATPIMYAHISIDRPSRLTDLLRTLEGKPELGKLIKSLHLGPTSHLPHHWWPLVHLHGPDILFALRSLATSLEDEAVLPRWCCPRRRWSLMHAGYTKSYRDDAVQAAIDAAQDSFGVSLFRPLHSRDGHLLTSDQWLARVMMVQAAVDLYLLEMRRLEDKSGEVIESWEGEPGLLQGPAPNSHKARLAYPRLEVTTSSEVTNVDDDDEDPEDPLEWYLPHTKVLEHLYRRGSLVDHFDHPVLFACSRMQLLDFEGNGRASLSVRFNERLRALYNDESGNVDFINLIEARSSRDTTSAGGILALARCLLALTPNVQHLYLSGFLQLLVAGNRRKKLPLTSLRSLCLGPLSLYSSDSLAPTIKGEDLAQLQELRVSGCLVAKEKVASIAAHPRLQRVSWDLAHSADAGEHIIGAVTSLKEALEATSDLNKTVGEDDEQEHPPSEAPQDVDRPHSPTTDRPRHVQVILNQQHFDRIVATEVGQEARTAGSEDLSLCDGPRTLVVSQDSPAILEPDELRWDGASAQAQAALLKSKEWWERRALGLPQ